MVEGVVVNNQVARSGEIEPAPWASIAEHHQDPVPVGQSVAPDNDPPYVWKVKRQGSHLSDHHESQEAVREPRFRRCFAGFARWTDSLMVGYSGNDAIIEPCDEPS